MWASGGGFLGPPSSLPRPSPKPSQVLCPPGTSQGLLPSALRELTLYRAFLGLTSFAPDAFGLVEEDRPMTHTSFRLDQPVTHLHLYAAQVGASVPWERERCYVLCLPAGELQP